MTTHEPSTDRVGETAPTGAESPARSVVVSGAAAGRTAGGGSPDVPAELVEATGPNGSAGPAVGVDGATDAADGPTGSDDVDAADDVDAVDVDDADAAVEAGEAPAAGAGSPGRAGWGRDLLLVGGVCLLALLVVNAFVARPFAVPSGSMENTLRPGDRLVVNELAYAFGGHVRRGDVVVFDGIGSFLPYAAEPSSGSRLLARVGLASGGDSVFVKRVIGVGGDRVTCCGSDGRIRVNGSPLDESGYLAPGDAPSSVPFDVLVPPGKLWVMGDHRSDSSDSRDHLGEPGGGFVPESQVIGRADWVVFPFGRWTSMARPGAFASIGGTGNHGDQG